MNKSYFSYFAKKKNKKIQMSIMKMHNKQSIGKFHPLLHNVPQIKQYCFVYNLAQTSVRHDYTWLVIICRVALYYFVCFASFSFIHSSVNSKIHTEKPLN